MKLRRKTRRKKKSRSFDKLALHREIDVDLRKKDRAKLSYLRGKVKKARKQWGKDRARAKVYCGAQRETARVQVARLRAAMRLKVRARAEALRRAARARCQLKRSAHRSKVDRARVAYRQEASYQASMRKNLHHAARKMKPRASLSERASESDDEVRQNIPADLIPLFERVRRQIKGSARKTRTEAFLEYVESHPREQYAAVEDEVDRMIAARERALRGS